MTTVIIDEKTKAGKTLIEYLRHSKHAVIVENENIPNETTLKAMDEVEEGKVTTYKSTKELMASLKGKAGV
ncbi:MAG: hypothetical protein JW798_18685 [Prolixibacteraceae bacterium]|nr:hypothetical protein [Prolixibacteraceae bacterium]